MADRLCLDAEDVNIEVLAADGEIRAGQGLQQPLTDVVVDGLGPEAALQDVLDQQHGPRTDHSQRWGFT